MDIVYLLLKIIAVCGMFTLMFLPLAKVTAWDDDSWYVRFVVSAVATTAWLGLLIFFPGAIITCAVVWAILLLLSIRHPSFRNLLPFWRWMLALRHRIKGDSPEFIVERVLGLRPIEDAPTDFKGVRDYLAAYRPYDDSGEALLEFSCGISGVTDDFVEKKAKDGLGAMGAEVCKVEHLGPGHWLLHFWKTEPKNPLDDAIEIKSSDLAQWDGKTVVYGLTEAGEPAQLSYAQTSGIVVGGVPGAGKSAGATLLTLPLLASPKASVAIFDGKGAWIGIGRRSRQRSTTMTVIWIWRRRRSSWKPSHNGAWMTLRLIRGQTLTPISGILARPRSIPSTSWSSTSVRRFLTSLDAPRTRRH